MLCQAEQLRVTFYLGRDFAEDDVYCYGTDSHCYLEQKKLHYLLSSFIGWEVVPSRSRRIREIDGQRVVQVILRKEHKATRGKDGRNIFLKK